MNRTEWRWRADRLLRERYGLSLADLADRWTDEAIRDAWASGTSPEAWIEYEAQHYDLTPVPTLARTFGVGGEPSSVIELSARRPRGGGHGA